MRLPVAGMVLTLGATSLVAIGLGSAPLSSTEVQERRNTSDELALVRSYAPTLQNFPNPERGFLRSFNPMFIGTERTPLDAAQLARLREQGASVIRAMYVIDESREGPLDSAALAAIAADFAAVRAGGVKIIPRFAYNFPCAGTLEPCQVENALDAPLERVIAHIDQLAPILQANTDVIAFMETGFVGAWGEWHHSSNNLVESNTRVNANSAAIVDRLLMALPGRRMIALRYPYHKQALLGASPLADGEAFTMSPRARVGEHNDCFLADFTDGGTYSNPYPPFGQDPERFKNYLNADNRFLPQGGETCSSAPPAQPFIQCPNALADLARMRWSTLNQDFQPEVIRSWRTQGCFDEIALRLGYRFRLIQADLPARAAQGGSLSVTLVIANDGWATPYNPRAAELVLRNVNGGQEYIATLPVDPRRWAPGSTTASVSVAVPPDVPPGTYRMLLNLPDPEARLHARAEYSIRLANEGLWESITGFNDLQADLEVVSNPAPQSVTASTAGSVLTVGWAAPATIPDGYLLEGGVSPGSVLASLPIAGSASTFSVSVPAGAYYIRLHALRSGTRSGPSNEVRVFVNVPLPPEPPTHLLGLANGPNLLLAWRNAGTGGLPSSMLLEVSGAATLTLPLPVSETFSYTGVPAGTYRLAVRTANVAGVSAPSNAVTLTFPSACGGPPGAPANLMVTRDGSVVSVRWDPPASGFAPAGYTLRVGGAITASFPTTSRALAGSVGPGTYLLSASASNACGTGPETPVQSIVVP